MFPLCLFSRSALFPCLLGVSLTAGCGNDSRAPSGRGEEENAAGGFSSGGQSASGGRTENSTLSSGGSKASGGTDGLGSGGLGSGGTPENLGGMGGEPASGGAGSEGSVEPEVIPCVPLDALPPAPQCPIGPFPAKPLLEGVEEELLCTKSSEVEWAEGPIWSSTQETLYFSNFDETDVDGFFNGSLMKYHKESGCQELYSQVGTNGLAWGPEGTLVVGRQSNRTLSRLELDSGELCSLADTFKGKRLSSPNDVAVRSDGNIYFSDPAWNLGARDEELPQALYQIAPSGELLLVSVYDQLRPNGVSLSPDETRLYVAITGSIQVFDVSEVGQLSNERRFVNDVEVDGMAIDCAGNVYASSGQIFSPQGEKIGEFWGGTNLAFGGPDAQTLFITGHRRLTSLRVAIPGLSY